MTTKGKASRITIDIRRHPRSEEHWNGIVTTTRGLCYFCTWADRPTEEKVIQAWREDRRDFLPYNCITGGTC